MADVDDSSKKLPDQASAVLEPTAPTRGDNAAIDAMTKGGNTQMHEVQIADLGKAPADSIADLGKLDDNAIADPVRRETFRARMGKIEQYDPHLFKKMTAIGDDIAANRPPTEIGQKLAKALQGTFDRNSQNGQQVDVTSDQFMTVLGGLSGLMLARNTRGQETVDMVKAAEAELSRVNRRTGVDSANGAVMELHPVRWADNKEPAMAAYSPGQGIDPLNFQPMDLQRGSAVKLTPGKKQP
jgi:hypothetical protein